MLRQVPRDAPEAAVMPENFSESTMDVDGWARPIGTPDWHYFRMAVLKSLCGRFDINEFSKVYPGNDNDTHNCDECRVTLFKD